MGRTKFQGVLPPILTPLTDNGALDHEGMHRLVQYVTDGGVNGLFVAGTTGEGPNLTDAQWAGAIETAAEAAPEGMPVYGGAIEPSTARVIEKVKRLPGLGAHVAVCTPPFYFTPPNRRQVVTHYLAVAEASELPLFIYTIPKMVGCHVEPATAVELAGHPNIIGMKDSSGDWTGFQRTLMDLGGRDDFEVLMGNEEQMVSALLFGADGIVPGSANVHPRLFREMFDVCRRGDQAAAWKIQSRLIDIRRIMTLGESFLPGYKTAMEMLGICGTAMTLPAPPLAAAERAVVRGILVAHDLLQGQE